jgi:hypothetical protein
MSHGSISAGSSFAESVSPVSACASFATATRSPATANSTGRCVLPSGLDRAPTFSSTSWSGWPRSAMPWPETCTGRSGRSVPEKTRTSEIRPTYGSEVVLTTSATSGPSGSQPSGALGSPSGVVTAGIRCSPGAGKPWVTSSSSSRVPTPVSAETGITG